MNRRRLFRCAAQLGGFVGLIKWAVIAATELPIWVLGTSENGSS